MSDEVQRSLVVPLHNEAARVGELLEQVGAWASGGPAREVVLVDDGSQDETVARVEAYLEAHAEQPLRLVRLEANRGKGAAVQAGILAARGRALAFTDADVPYGLAAVDRVHEALEAGAEVVCGARVLSAGAPVPWTRRAISAGFRLWTSLWVECGAVQDTQAGIKGFSREAGRRLFAELRREGFEFDQEVLGLANAWGLRVEVLEVELLSHGPSSVTLRNATGTALLGPPRAGWAVARRARPEPTRLGRLDLLCSLACALFVLAALAYGGALHGGRDWDQFEADLIVATRALSGGELPFWTPARVGGHDAWADPQSTWASPLGLFSWGCGVPWGIRLFLAWCAGVAALGGAGLAGRLGCGLVGRCVVGLSLGVGGPLGLFAAGGIPTFSIAWALLPWVVWCLVVGSRPALVAGGALLALDFFGGGINHLIFHALYLSSLALVLALLERRPRRLLGLVFLGLVCFVVSAPKLVPAAYLAKNYPRHTASGGRGALTPRLVAHALFEREAVRFVEAPFHEFVGLRASNDELVHGPHPADLRLETLVDWVDTGTYVGLLGGALALCGALWRLWGRGDLEGRLCLGILLAGLPLLWLGFGSNLRPSAWELLRPLPVFSSLRSPARLVIYLAFPLVLLSGVGAQACASWLGGLRRAGLARACLCGLLAIHLLDVAPPSWRAYRQVFVEGGISGAPVAEFRQVRAPAPQRGQSTRYGPPVAPYARLGLGVANGYTAVPVRPCALAFGDPGYRGEAFLEGPGRVGSLQVGARSLGLLAGPSEPGRLILNFNHLPGWSLAAPAGATLSAAEDGRLAVDLPAGSARVELRYASPGAWLGLWILILGLPCVAWLSLRLAPVLARGARP